MLRVRRIKRGTLLQYADHVDDFVAWARRYKLGLSTDHKVDVAMSTFFNALFEDALGMNVASYTLFGWICLKMIPKQPERQLLPLSRAALTAWRGISPGGSRVGVPPQVIFAFAEFCIQKQAVQAAVAALIQYDLFCRPSEVLLLKGRDIVPPVKNLCGSWGAIIGNSDFQERTKVGRFDDVILADSTHRSWCGKLLQHISKGRHHLDIPLFQLTLPQFEDLCRQFSCKHQLKQGLFTPHVIRHSGPSFDCIHHHRSLPQIQERGRWSCAASVNRYKRPGRLLLEASRLPAVLRNYKCEKLSATLASIFSCKWVCSDPVPLP